jgi:hypothetical protein
MEKKTEQRMSSAGSLADVYEKPEIKDFGDLFELTAGGSIRGGFDQLHPNNPKAVKCVVTCFS